MSKEDLKQCININLLLSHLSQSTNKTRLRRCAILANRYILSLDQAETIEVIKLVLFLVAEKQDRVVQYEALMCIKALAQGLDEEKVEVQWTLILEQVAPTIVQLLENFQRANIVWPLLQLLSKLIQKCQYQSIDSIRLSFEKANFMHLMSTTSELLVGALYEMLKSLIVCFPPHTPMLHIFTMGFTLVINNLKSTNTGVFKLWYFLLQEYCSLQGMDGQVSGLLVNNFQLLL